MHKVEGAEAGQQARPARGGGAKFHITFWAVGVTAAFGDIKAESSTILTGQQGSCSCRKSSYAAPTSPSIVKQRDCWCSTQSIINVEGYVVKDMFLPPWTGLVILVK